MTYWDNPMIVLNILSHGQPSGYQRGGLMDKTLGLSDERSGARILGRGK